MMKQTMADFVKLQAREAESGLTNHPPSDELVAYHRGRLSGDDENRLQSHLEVCRDCSALYLDLVEMVEETPPVDSTEWADAWPEMERRLKEEIPETAPLPSFPHSEPRQPFWQAFFTSPRPAYAVATVFFLATCGLLAWNLSLRQTLGVILAPHMNVPVHDLDSASLLRTEGGAVNEPVEVMEGTDRIVLVLNPTESPSELSYRVRILDDSGREVWSGRGLRPNSFGSFTLEISRRFLPDERYVIELRGDRDVSGRDVPVDRFEVRLPGG